MELSRTGRWLLTQAHEKTVARLWEIPGREGSDSIPVRLPPTSTNVHISPDGSLIAFVEGERTLWLWSVATGTKRRLGEQPGRINNLSFSPDGATLATAGEDGTLTLWPVPTPAPATVNDGPPRLLEPKHSSGIHLIGFSPDGRRIVSVSHDGEIRDWDVTRGEGH